MDGTDDIEDLWKQLLDGSGLTPYSLANRIAEACEAADLTANRATVQGWIQRGSVPCRPTKGAAFDGSSAEQHARTLDVLQKIAAEILGSDESGHIWRERYARACVKRMSGSSSKDGGRRDVLTGLLITFGQSWRPKVSDLNINDSYWRQRSALTGGDVPLYVPPTTDEQVRLAIRRAVESTSSNPWSRLVVLAGAPGVGKTRSLLEHVMTLDQRTEIWIPRHWKNLKSLSERLESEYPNRVAHTPTVVLLDDLHRGFDYARQTNTNLSLVLQKLGACRHVAVLASMHPIEARTHDAESWDSYEQIGLDRSTLDMIAERTVTLDGIFERDQLLNTPGFQEQLPANTDLAALATSMPNQLASVAYLHEAWSRFSEAPDNASRLRLLTLEALLGLWIISPSDATPDDVRRLIERLSGNSLEPKPSADDIRDALLWFNAPGSDPHAPSFNSSPISGSYRLDDRIAVLHLSSFKLPDDGLTREQYRQAAATYRRYDDTVSELHAHRASEVAEQRALEEAQRVPDGLEGAPGTRDGATQRQTRSSSVKRWLAVAIVTVTVTTVAVGAMILRPEDGSEEAATNTTESAGDPPADEDVSAPDDTSTSEESVEPEPPDTSLTTPPVQGRESSGIDLEPLPSALDTRTFRAGPDAPGFEIWSDVDSPKPDVQGAILLVSVPRAAEAVQAEDDAVRAVGSFLVLSNRDLSDGGSKPVQVSTLNIASDRTVSNIALVPTTDGKITIYSQFQLREGAVTLDLIGFVSDEGPIRLADTPTRLWNRVQLDQNAEKSKTLYLDGEPEVEVTPTSTGAVPSGPDDCATEKPTSQLDVEIPSTASGVILNVTTDGTSTGSGFIQVYSTVEGQQLSPGNRSSLNPAESVPTANLVIVPIGPDRTVEFRSAGVLAAGKTSRHCVIVDLIGWIDNGDSATEVLPAQAVSGQAILLGVAEPVRAVVTPLEQPGRFRANVGDIVAEALRLRTPGEDTPLPVPRVVILNVTIDSDLGSLAPPPDDSRPANASLEPAEPSPTALVYPFGSAASLSAFSMRWLPKIDGKRTVSAQLVFVEIGAEPTVDVWIREGPATVLVDVVGILT